MEFQNIFFFHIFCVRYFQINWTSLRLIFRIKWFNIVVDFVITIYRSDGTDGNDEWLLSCTIYLIFLDFLLVVKSFKNIVVNTIDIKIKIDEISSQKHDNYNPMKYYYIGQIVFIFQNCLNVSETSPDWK